jgi:hypothetical protein
MKIAKTKIFFDMRTVAEMADDGEIPAPVYVLDRNVGFTDWDFNRLRVSKKNCILDYKTMNWSGRGGLEDD